MNCNIWSFGTCEQLNAFCVVHLAFLKQLNAHLAFVNNSMHMCQETMHVHVSRNHVHVISVKQHNAMCQETMHVLDDTATMATYFIT